jgi:hypothetical protein
LPGFDFDTAITWAWRLRPLPEPFRARNFDRLMVLGMHLSAIRRTTNSARGADRQPPLSPAGIGFIAQGTPTNHTADVRPASRRKTPKVMQLCAGDRHPVRAAEDLENRRATAEAWDVDYERLILANAVSATSRRRTHEPRATTATIGYFRVARNRSGRQRSGAAVLHLGCGRAGSLPAIRVGKQPYGLLVTAPNSGR